ncbi:MAG: preprotein translocase subunit SecG [Arenicella sp.]|jgi:preprotein translocase subunit SecG
MILLILTATVLTLLILIQNPQATNKGVASFVGAKSSNGVLKNGTWLFGLSLFVLTLALG